MPVTAATSLRALACLALTTCACARTRASASVPPWTVQVDADLSIAAPPGMSDPIPTELRIYQLHSLGSFEAASYEQLHDDDKAALGESLVTKYPDRVFVYPRRPWRAELEIGARTRFVVVVAFLHRPVGRSWSYVAALPPGVAPGTTVTAAQLAARPSGFTVKIGPDRVSGRPQFPPPPPPSRARRGLRKLPQIPTVPSVPSLPTLPRAPTAPGVPTTPTAPSVPTRPTAPTLPAPPRR